MEEFLHSMRGGFADDRSHAARSLWVLGLLVLAMLLVWLAARLARTARARAALRALATTHGFLDLLPFVRGLAAKAQRNPLEMLAHVDLFEHATRLALQANSGDASVPKNIRRLREALGYDRLPETMPLFTTRELSAGTEVHLGEHRGETRASSETVLSINFLELILLGPGETVTLEVPHAREQPYQLHCELLESAERDGARLLSFAHDEAPLRQRVADVRFAARGAVTLHPAFSSSGEVVAETVAQLVEASAHDLLVESALKLPAGHLYDCSFSLAGQSFSRVRAIALPDKAGEPGRHRTCVELRGMSEHEVKRLKAALETLRQA